MRSVFLAISALSFLKLLQTSPVRSPKCLSIWRPFCDEKIFYQPYINIWKGGAHKELYRSRGPGYIDVSGLKDIYICTNGLVMYYFGETKGQGNLIEDGVLKWLPHHCAFYNPSCGPGNLQPVRRLRALLLIAHPRDYRLPALQMFVAPYYDVGWKTPPRVGLNKYINLTSLLMISDEGECLIEKGNGGESMIRVQVNHPEFPHEIKEEHKDAPKFCRIDSARHLGTIDDFDPIAINDQVDQNPMSHLEARTQIVQNLFFGAHFYLANDYKLAFKGCSLYPLFNLRIKEIVETNSEIYNSESHPQYTPMETIDDINPDPDRPDDGKKSKWWNKVVRDKARHSMPEYNVKEEPNNWFNDSIPSEYEVKWNESKHQWFKHRDELNDLIKNHTDLGTIREAQETEFQSYTSYHIYPYLEEFKQIKDFTMIKLQGDLRLKWDAAKKTIEDLNLTGLLQEYEIRQKRLSEIANEMRLHPYYVNLTYDYIEVEKEKDEILKELKQGSILLARNISIAETLTNNYWRHRKTLDRIRDKFRKAVEKVEKRQPLGKFVNTEWPLKDVVISMVNLGPDDYRICDVLPSLGECSRIKPTSLEASQLLAAVKGKVEWESPADQWRDNVFSVIQDIFVTACPYIQDTGGFVQQINNVVKAYLNHVPYPSYVPRNESSINWTVDSNHTWQSYVYNETIHLSPNLTLKRPLWDPLMDALYHCASNVKPMEFYGKANENTQTGDSSYEILFRKFNPNNETYQEFPTSELFMMEQADKEYAFNWAIDMNWKIFATVLGTCLEFYPDKMALVNSHLYSMYYEDFLHPLRQNWMNNRHNPIFRVIFGQYYPTGKAQKWVDICMESSFVKSGDVFYRPLRWILVNSFTELNFFTNGPMSGTNGMYFTS